MITLNKGLREFVIVTFCLLVVLCNGCFSYVKEEVLTIKARLDADKEVTPSSLQQNTTEEVSTPVDQKTASVTTSDQQGKGYLKDGSTVSLGVLDGDEELQILEKIKRLEKKLNKEIKKREAIVESLTEMKAAKDKVEGELKELEWVNNNLLEDIKALETQKKELEEKVAAAEQQSEQLEKKILDSQIAETKAEQELYKLKIEGLEEEQKEP
ncbi:MAG: hypothetical protein JYX80_07280 [Candidatus Scalindua sediminis]|nr:hypothetical protein [Candidatus Scalindua sediminis]HDY68019.1 hypothetical protein [Candidatus Scalindua sp.]